ncbi:MAG: glycosyltransferase 87 family protein [Roseiarcus sp.]
MILTAKALLAIVALAFTWRAQLLVADAKLPSRVYDRWILLIVAITRLGVYGTIFFVLNYEPQSDLVVYYVEAGEVRDGKIPLVDIATAYGPGFDYVVAAITQVWNSSKAIVLFSLILELCSVPVWMKVGRRAFTEDETRRAAALYALNPLAISTVAIAGQNHVWQSLLLALSLLAAARERDAMSGLWLGVSVVAVKFLALLFAPVVFLGSRRRAVWATAFLAPPLVGYAIVMALGAQPWRQVMFHALHASSGNLPFLLSLAGVTLATPDQRLAADALALGVLCALFLAAVWRYGAPTGARAVVMCAFVLIVTLLVQKKAFASYLIIVMFPLALAAAAQPRPRLALMFVQAVSALATLEPSLWFRWLEQNDLSSLMQPTLPDGVARPEALAFLLCDMVLVASYVVLLAMLWRTGATSRSPAGAASPEACRSPAVCAACGAGPQA